MMQRRTPLVSIICNCYNHAPFIAETIEGFLSQKTNFSFEILIHDDASTDESQKIIEMYAQRHPELIFPIYQKVNQYSQNIKPTIHFQYPRARGKYIALCEGDDFWTSADKLQKQVDFLQENQDYVICFHDSRVLHEQKDKSSHSYFDFSWNKINKNTDTFTILDALKGPFIPTSSIVFRSEALPIFPDWFHKCASGDIATTILLCASKNQKIKLINECWSTYRKHQNGITNLHKGDQILINRIEMMIRFDSYLQNQYHNEIKNIILSYYTSLSAPNEISQSIQDKLSSDYGIANSLSSLQNQNYNFCTIITESHIPYARALLDSLIKLRKNSVLHVLVVDSNHQDQDSNPNLKFYSCTDLEKKKIFSDLNKKYSQKSDILRWSLKPVFIQYLLESDSYDELIYLDCDIHFYSDFKFLFEYLEDSSILLTPHWRSSDPEIDKSNFDTLLTSGHFNAGFLGCSKRAISALEWWAKSCLYECTIDPSRGHYVDQTYLDLFPVLFEDVKILRHKGCNVANWNQIECRRDRDNSGTVVINSLFPIVFIHFTASTIRGIVNGQDTLLTPHLHTYISSLKKYDQNLDIISHHLPIQVQETLPKKIVRQTSTNRNIPQQSEDLNIFTHPILSASNIDVYHVRKSILQFIKSILPELKGTLLDVGCGQMPYRSLIEAGSNINNYLGLDLDDPKYNIDKNPELKWDGKIIPLPDNSIDCAIATEVFEHVPHLEEVLQEIRRVLKPDGMLYFTVPFLWPLHDAPYDEYRYTPFALKRILEAAKFFEIDLRSLGGWNASFAQMMGLWLKRAPMLEQIRTQQLQQLMPLYEQLISSNDDTDIYKNQSMHTGVAGKARVKKRKQLGTEKLVWSHDTTHHSTDEKTTTNMKIAVMQSGFPALSATFILDQIVGLQSQGVHIEHWATYQTNESITHTEVHKNELQSRTRYLEFPESHQKMTDAQWSQEFLALNQIESVSDLNCMHIHYGSNFNLLKPLLRTYSLPVLVSFHGHDASRYVQKNGPLCYLELFERASLITVPSSVMRDTLIELGCANEKIIIHHYGIDTNRFQNTNRERPNSDKVKFLTVARLTEKKGIEYSLLAFAQLLKSHNAEYVIVGEGERRTNIENMIRDLGIQHSVRLLGARSRECVIEEMSHADIFVLTSVTASDGDQEGLPVSLTEAAASGLACISSTHAGIPDLIVHQDTGLLSPERDVHSIYENMKYLIQNPKQRHKLGVNSRETVLRNFNIQTLNKSLFSIIQSISHSGQTTESTSVITSQLTHVDFDLSPLLMNFESRPLWKTRIQEYCNDIAEVEMTRKTFLPECSVIILSWQFTKELELSLHRLRSEENQNYEIIFINNGADEDCYADLRDYFDIYIRLHSNLGAYMARNIGAGFSSAPIILFLDDDAVPCDGFVQAHLEQYTRYDIIAARGAVIPRNPESHFNDLAKHYYLGSTPFPVYCDTEGNVSYLKETFLQAGGWDDNIKFGGGGPDLSIRLLSVEPDYRKQIYAPEPVIFHDYVKDAAHLERKRTIQGESRARLYKKHPYWDKFIASWGVYHQRSDMLLRRNELLSQDQYCNK